MLGFELKVCDEHHWHLFCAAVTYYVKTTCWSEYECWANVMCILYTTLQLNNKLTDCVTFTSKTHGYFQEDKKIQHEWNNPLKRTTRKVFTQLLT